MGMYVQTGDTTTCLGLVRPSSTTCRMEITDMHHTHSSPQRQDPGERQHYARKRAGIFKYLHAYGSQHTSLCDDQQKGAEVVRRYPKCNNEPGYQY
eukprot:6461144-Pyramimonas_sp.AAC.1